MEVLLRRLGLPKRLGVGVGGLDGCLQYPQNFLLHGCLLTLPLVTLSSVEVE